MATKNVHVDDACKTDANYAFAHLQVRDALISFGPS